MMRNSRNIRPIPGRLSGPLIPAGVSRAAAPASLMTLRSDTFEAIDHRGLGHAERKPSGDLALQRDVELIGELSRLRCDIPLLLKLELKRELADQRQVFAARAPQGDVAFGQNPFTEIKLA